MINNSIKYSIIPYSIILILLIPFIENIINILNPDFIKYKLELITILFIPVLQIPITFLSIYYKSEKKLNFLIFLYVISTLIFAPLILYSSIFFNLLMVYITIILMYLFQLFLLYVKVGLSSKSKTKLWI